MFCHQTGSLVRLADDLIMDSLPVFSPPDCGIQRFPNQVLFRSYCVLNQSMQYLLGYTMQPSTIPTASFHSYRLGAACLDALTQSVHDMAAAWGSPVFAAPFSGRPVPAEKDVVTGSVEIPGATRSPAGQLPLCRINGTRPAAG